MSEHPWLRATDPQQLLNLVGDAVTPRKQRLLACACCRLLWPWVQDDRSRTAVAAAERFADGAGTEADLATAYQAGREAEEAANHAKQAALFGSAQDPSWSVARQESLQVLEAAAGAAADAAAPSPSRVLRYTTWVMAKTGVGPEGWEERWQQAGDQLTRLVHDLVGDPFRPLAFDPGWRTSAVRRLAVAAYDERRFPSGRLDAGRLAVLADALEDQGCIHADLLAHLRGGGVHVRGCWALDLVLGKE